MKMARAPDVSMKRLMRVYGPMLILAGMGMLSAMKNEFEDVEDED